MQKHDFRNSEECMRLPYKETENMTIDDAIYTLEKSVNAYHKAAKSEKYQDLIFLPRPWMVRVYEIAIECMKKCKEKDKINL